MITPAETGIDGKHYVAVLEEELAKVNRERLMLRAALNQQAETLEAVYADRDRWKKMAKAPFDTRHLPGDAPERSETAAEPEAVAAG